jgi:hypothetical protein
MSAPVTRAELRNELGELETRVGKSVDTKLAALEARVDTKLDLWGGALLDRIAQVAQQITQLAQQSIASEQRLSVEMARHANAISEDLTVRVAIVDEKYADLPVRVARLESIVDK